MRKLSLDEVVDDSEPEREERRQEDRYTRERVSSRKARDTPLLTAREVIELTDDESGPSYTTPSIVYDRPNVALQCDAQTLALNGIHSPSDALSANAIRKNSGNIPSEKLPSSGGPSTGSTNGDCSDKDDLKINLAHFAYIGSHPSPRVPDPRPGPSHEGSITTIECGTKLPQKKRAPKSHRFSADFSDAELAKLTKCVSCDIRWTARKTGAQKKLHMQSCAKKNSFTDETIRILIRKELDIAVTLDVQTKGKVLVETPPDSLVPKTFFEDIVADAAPKKKGRRVKSSETVKSITATRSVILGRARAVLGGPSNLDGEFAAHTQTIGRTNLGESGIFPSTQIFRPSALAQRHLVPSRASFMDEAEGGDSKSEAAPPATQVFAPSKLGGNPGRLPSHGHTCSPSAPYLGSINISSTNNEPLYLRHNYLIDPLNLSARDVTPCQASVMSDSTRESAYDAFLPGNNASTDGIGEEHQGNIDGPKYMRHQEAGYEYNNDAYLHFDATSNQERAETISRTPGTHRPPRRLRRTSTNSECEEEPMIMSTQKNHAIRDVRVRQQVVEQGIDHDEMWETYMRERIVQDNDLHLRILRYEPIHFDMFLKLAQGETSLSTKSKARLRLLLDKLV